MTEPHYFPDDPFGPTKRWRGIEMLDIVERLNPANLRGVDQTTLSLVEIDTEILNLAIAEIMRLRTTIEQMQQQNGQTFAQIRDNLRPLTKEKAEEITKRCT